MMKNNYNRMLPQLEQCTYPIVLKDTDIFITAAGFEERSIKAASHVRGEKGSIALVLEYLPFDARNQISIITQILKASGAAVFPVEFDRWDANAAWGALYNRLSELCQTHHNVFLDVSGLTRFAIMIALEVIRICRLCVTVIYAEAERYGPTLEEYNIARSDNNILQPSLQVYSGIENVLQVSALSSVSMQGQPTCLISFLSFNENFVQTLLNRLNPSKVILINGSPPVHTWREEATAWIHSRLIGEWGADNKLTSDGLLERKTSTLDYRETVNELFSIYWSAFATHRIVLAPCGSKMQAIGSYLVRAVHPDIHIECPVARGYLDQYSYGVGPVWKLKLGNVQAMIDRLKKNETRRHLRI